jgi:hypothetical protein
MRCIIGGEYCLQADRNASNLAAKDLSFRLKFHDRFGELLKLLETASFLCDFTFVCFTVITLYLDSNSHTSSIYDPIYSVVVYLAVKCHPFYFLFILILKFTLKGNFTVLICYLFQ